MEAKHFRDVERYPAPNSRLPEQTLDHPTASLSRIASAAEVGRATIHRYFPNRAALHAALMTDSWSVLRGAIEAAHPGVDSVMDVIQRIVAAMVYAGD